MFGKSLVRLFVPLTLVAALGACTQGSGAVQPGIVNTAAPGAPPDGYRGEQGRVVAMNETRLRGGGGSGFNDGTMTGGGIGLAGGAMAGAAIGRGSVGGVLIGGLLGAVGGAIAGTVINRQGGTQRGVEVTVQKDDGQTVTIAQPDDGRLQTGDQVMIVYNRDGVARAVSDNSQGGQSQGGQQSYPPQRDYNSPQRGYYPPQQDYSPNSPQRIDYQPR